MKVTLTVTDGRRKVSKKNLKGPELGLFTKAIGAIKKGGLIQILDK